MGVSSLPSQTATDFTAFDQMRALARKDQQAALPKVAKQFESIFIQSMLKSMRQANSFLSDNNPLNSKDVLFFRDMLDQQLSVDLANQKGIGLAEVMIRQMEKALSGKKNQPTPMEQASSVNQKQATQKVAGSDLPMKARDNQAAETRFSSKQTFSDKFDFLSTLWPLAKKAGEVLGLDPKMLLAQASLETGWGKSIIKDQNGNSSHNVFNIKSKGKSEFESIATTTTEFVSGVAMKMVEPFKQYKNLMESFSDYMQLVMGHERYSKAMENTQDAKQYIRELQRAGYATDPKYADKIIKIYDGEFLNETLKKLEVN